VDLRDQRGLTQIVFDPEVSAKSHEIAESVRGEWVLRVCGTVRRRGKGLENPNLATGEIEVFAENLEVLNRSETPPFELDEHLKNVREDLRLEYRYLDLRRPKMAENLRLRHEMTRTIRNFFDGAGFCEIETPVMIKGTPEGSREYLVPSRLHAGKFYALPQSPQQLKQLLILGGVDKYFQIARCFRDEDLRGDRQPEFTQFEIEMAFCEEDDILEIIEKSFVDLTEKCASGREWRKFLKNGKFRRFSWREAMEKFGTDKPDLRFGLEFANISDIGKNSGFGIFEKCENLFALPVPRSVGEFSRKNIDDLTDLARQNGAGGLAWLRVGEDSGPVAKNAKKEFLDELISRTGSAEGDLIFFGAHDDFIKSVEPLGAVRGAIGDQFNLKNPDEFAYCWVVDFPLFERKEDGSIGAAHHPFTRPHAEDRKFLKSDPLRVKSHAYDLVMNGVELGGGSMRIHEPDLQREIFEALGMDEDEIQMKFGHLLRAFKFGCPPHGGCAMGLDRVVMLFAGEPNIREVIAFPKNQSAQDLLLGAPSEMPEDEVREQNIEVLEE